ncbi:MFS transporter [Ottowia caeni]|uniref:MFS transporter n=1 Tax=Ottowia caeni TaxID=2870339 RepID=UPI001E379126|nr:MFS transporter [Ottowia caeni]
MSTNSQRQVVARLGTTQTLAWASSYYLPALLAAPLASELGLPVTSVFGAFTLALLISALIGPLAGRAIDEHGGRKVLIVTNVLFASGLTGLALVQNEFQLWAAWALLGLAMGSGLYDAAFATVVRLYPANARNAITGITLVAGFASTVGWPLTAWWIETLGWRGTCLAWAALHVVLGAPLHWWLPRRAPEVIPTTSIPPTHSQVAEAPQPVPSWIGMAMAVVFAIVWFTSTAMATHLPTLLQDQGLSATAALGIAMLVGPAQVAGRLLEFGILRHISPLLSARMAAAAHPLGVVGFMILGPASAWLFAFLHGAGNGILTIAKGTLPLVVFGATGYGQRQGWIMAPARVAQAAAPLLFGMAVVHWSSGALWLTTALGLLACLLLQAMAARLRR